jgi:hypothetical protein
MLSLTESLKRFSPANLETPNASFLTNLPWIGPAAYLNVIYKPASPTIVNSVAEELHFPPSLVQFYRLYNGACLFLDGLRIYGCLEPNLVIDRTSPLTLPPFDIRAVNREFRGQRGFVGLICIGSYGYDRSMVCMDREKQTIVCFKGTNLLETRKTWQSLEEWMRDELERLVWMFTPDGKRLVEEHLMVPGAAENYRN